MPQPPPDPGAELAGPLAPAANGAPQPPPDPRPPPTASAPAPDAAAQPLAAPAAAGAAAPPKPKGVNKRKAKGTHKNSWVKTYYMCPVLDCMWSGSSRTRHAKAKPLCTGIPVALRFEPGADVGQMVRTVRADPALLAAAQATPGGAGVATAPEPSAAAPDPGGPATLRPLEQNEFRTQSAPAAAAPPPSQPPTEPPARPRAQQPAGPPPAPDPAPAAAPAPAAPAVPPAAAPAAPPAAAPAVGDAPDPPPKWVCTANAPACETENDADEENCELCDGPRPTAGPVVQST